MCHTYCALHQLYRKLLSVCPQALQRAPLSNSIFVRHLSEVEQQCIPSTCNRRSIMVGCACCAHPPLVCTCISSFIPQLMPHAARGTMVELGDARESAQGTEAKHPAAHSVTPARGAGMLSLELSWSAKLARRREGELTTCGLWKPRDAPCCSAR